jgi:hypothetical protein
VVLRGIRLCACQFAFKIGGLEGFQLDSGSKDSMRNGSRIFVALFSSVTITMR